MKEDFLHYLWQYQEFDKTRLLTSSKETVQLISVGLHNADAGPDFLNARVQLDGMLWSGAVEIHIRSSDWYRHKHEQDQAYNNVVLHVVWEDDVEVKRSDGTLVPAIALKERVLPALLSRYQQFFQAGYQERQGLLCKHQLPVQDPLTVLSVMENALVQRIERKSGEILQLLDSNRGDWNETIYQSLAKGFGFKLNAEPFLALAKALPLSGIGRLGNKPESWEAAYFGQAGFLDQPMREHYPKRLQEEYQYIAKKYHLQNQKMQAAQWKFSRLRPANFPTIRIVQLLGFMYRHASHMQTLIKEREVDNLLEKFRIKSSAYWQDHNHFERPCAQQYQRLGKDSIYNLIINVVIPLKFAYARFFHDENLAEKTFLLLQEIPAEKNKIIRQLKPLGFPVKSAFDSQAIIELYNNHCSLHKCLQCKIGLSVLKKSQAEIKVKSRG